jgi:uncharacterized membrane protein
MADLTLAVRVIHLLGVAVIVGGAALLAALAARRPDLAREAGRLYETWFWGAAALIAVTGVGNLGAFGSVPARGTPWGNLFAVKILLFLGFLALSMARTLLVARGRAKARAYGAAYGATAALAGAIATLGVALAHG